MKEGNYYEIKGSAYNFYPVKLIKLTDSNFTIESLLEKKKITLSRKHYIIRELSISQSHIDRLGFENKSKIQSIQGISIFPIIMIFRNDNMKLNLDFFGYKVIRSNDLQSFKINYLKKYDELSKLTNQEYDEKYSEIQKQLRNEFDLILNINELFEKLESLNFSIENKDSIIIGK